MATVDLRGNDKHEYLWLEKYLKPLVGATIVEAGAAVSDDFGVQVWPRIVVQTKDGKRIELTVQQDPEGNGPGFVEGLPHVTVR